MARVYISSSYRDLIEFRRRAAEKLTQMGHVPVGMEADGASEHPPLHECLKDVRSCHAYVGILGLRYGGVPPGETRSYTELEYDEAGRREEPKRLVFLTSPSVSDYPPGFVDADRRAIGAFRERVRAHTVVEFSSPAELARELERTIKQQLGIGRVIPPLLPYLCDRQGQIDALSQALLTRRDRRPVLFVIHGDRRELHDRFVERISLVTLPDHLDLPSSDRVLKLKLAWPETRGDDRQRHEWFATRLAETGLRLKKIPSGGVEEILGRIAAFRTPVLVSATVSIEAWSKETSDTILAFTRFWRGSPDFPSEHPLVVCLSIVYPSPKPMRWSLFGRRDAGAISDKVEQLRLAEASDVTVAIAPRLGLDSVSRQHVENWIAGEVSKLPEEFSLDEDALRRRIEAFFSEYERSHGTSYVPMDDLAQCLKRELDACSARQKSRREIFA